MFNRSTAFVLALALYASDMQAKANLIGMPLNLGLASGATIKARTVSSACMQMTDDVFAGPVAVWSCERRN